MYGAFFYDCIASGETSFKIINSGGRIRKVISQFSRICFIVLLLADVTTAYSAGPSNVSPTGVASAWNNSTSIKYHPEDGTCGPFSNSGMIDRFGDLMSLWTSLPEVDLQMEAVTGLLGQVGIDNYTDFIALSTADTGPMNDNLNPVIFDNDASIVAELVGEENKYLILGFAGATKYSSDETQILDGQSLINCACIEGQAPCFVDSLNEYLEISEEELNFTILHEMGHFLNLDHSNANSLYYDNGGINDDQYIPVMFPVSFESSGQAIAPRTDDIVSLAAIYPSQVFQDDWCTVTGVILDEEQNELMCADVWAYRNADAADTISNVTGSYRVAEDNNDDGDEVDDGECTSNCGRFSFRIQKDKGYIISTNPINTLFTGGSSVGPCVNGQQSGVVEEDLYTIDISTCTGGITIDLGNLQSSSTGGVATGDGGTSNGGSNGSSGGSGANGGYDSNLNPFGYGSCQLNSLSSASNSNLSSMVGFCFALIALCIVRVLNLSADA